VDALVEHRRQTTTMTTRVTDCEAGPIRHRPGTRLTPRRHCDRGHLAPRYVADDRCVACAKIASLSWYYRQRDTEGGGQVIEDYAKARRHHLQFGGYLIRLGQHFLVTSDVRTVQRHRGNAWVRRCDALGIWDEVELEAAGLPGRRRRSTLTEARAAA
jgi:hypothetical protein